MRTRRRFGGFTILELLVVITIIFILAAVLFPAFAKAQEKARQASCSARLKQLGQAMTMYVQDYDSTYPKVGFWGYDAIRGTNRVITWYEAMYQYVTNDEIFQCPSHPITIRDPATGILRVGYGLLFPNYGYLDYVDWPAVSSSHMRWPAETVITSDTGYVNINPTAAPDEWVEDPVINRNFWYSHTPDSGTLFWQTDPQHGVNRHNGMCNILYADVHVKATKVSTIGYQFNRQDRRAQWNPTRVGFYEQNR